MNQTTLSQKEGKVRKGKKPPPRRLRAFPTLEAAAKKLEAYCCEVSITQLEAFGSFARGEATRGSDVDLLATFSRNPGLRFFAMEAEMAKILGVPVHLLTRDSVEQMTNPYRRGSIFFDARVIYQG